MSIEITIIYSPDSVLIEQSSYIFPDKGATLGRAASNFWVLEDPNKYMSSVHANIACEAGQYYLTDMSTNGTFINGAAEPVGNGNQVLLNDGDQFTISDYEFVVKLSATESVETPISSPQGNNPFADIAPEKSNDPFAGTSSFDDASSNAPFSGFDTLADNNDPFASASIGANFANDIPSVEAEASTDPLALLDKSDKSDRTGDPFAINDASSDLFSNNSFTTTDFADPTVENNSVMSESIEWPTANAEGSIIPEDWDDWDDNLGISSDASVLNTQPSAINPVTAIDPMNANPVQNNPIPDPFSTQSSNEAVFTGSEVNNLNSDPFNNAGFTANDPLTETEGNNALFSEPLVAPDILPEQDLDCIEPVVVPPQPGRTQAAVPQPGRTQSKVGQPQENIAVVTATSQQAKVEEKSHTRSEAEYVNLEQQNQQLRNEIAELKLQLSHAHQAQDTASTSALNTDTSAALNMVVDAMGLSKWNLSDSKKVEVNETVGLLIRETMQGMMQVLKFRKKIKEEFRINVTTIQSVENNPLKFSANIDDALENMFIKENNAYKAPVDAVKEGFQGIAEHQVAVVAGMQAAFKGLIERFDPDHLEGRFEKYKSTGLLSLGRTKRWNAYKEYHKGLVENLDDSFQHLFGYDFVQAYEEQMQSLIRARVDVNNNNEPAQ
ncbi:MAG: type VI secretion system-associated FHA domain protein TagH [Alteromonadales bacterium]|nr:type VI secretion system-associated FHA domain protein TagH [Alteromonadales bacterium]